MATIASVAIIGAGPYGLSIAAHLSARGIRPLVFGSPMQSWREAMPTGMHLKSEGFASSLSDPEGGFTLEAYCESEKLPYADINLPVPRKVFVAYGDAFQRRFVAQLDTRMVDRIRKAPHGFTLQLEDGVEVDAGLAIVAAGIHPFRRVPEPLRDLSPARLSHSCEHADYSRFAGQRVVVIGAGSSATDVAAELVDVGAKVTLLCRGPSLRFYPGGQPRGLLDPLMAPMTPLGPGWKKLACVHAPLLFRAMPARFRTRIVQRFLGPAPCWFVREKIEGKIEVKAASKLVAARETAQGVALDVVTAGVPARIEADHVICGTGYRLDVKRLRFLDAPIVSALELTEDAPKLSANFESSVPGLHFVGTLAAYEFGPLLRFVCGAEFTARRVAKHVAAAVTSMAAAGEGEHRRRLDMSADRRQPCSGSGMR